MYDFWDILKTWTNSCWASSMILQTNLSLSLYPPLYFWAKAAHFKCTCLLWPGSSTLARFLQSRLVKFHAWIVPWITEKYQSFSERTIKKMKWTFANNTRELLWDEWVKQWRLALSWLPRKVFNKDERVSASLCGLKAITIRVLKAIVSDCQDLTFISIIPTQMVNVCDAFSFFWKGRARWAAGFTQLLVSTPPPPNLKQTQTPAYVFW
jgi:hypothetical protein